MPIVCIDGIIGAGKSTLIRKLKNKFTCFEEPIKKWSLLPKLHSDMERYVVPFQFQVYFRSMISTCRLRTSLIRL